MALLPAPGVPGPSLLSLFSSFVPPSRAPVQPQSQPQLQPELLETGSFSQAKMAVGLEAPRWAPSTLPGPRWRSRTAVADSRPPGQHRPAGQPTTPQGKPTPCWLGVHVGGRLSSCQDRAGSGRGAGRTGQLPTALGLLRACAWPDPFCQITPFMEVFPAGSSQHSLQPAATS